MGRLSCTGFLPTYGPAWVNLYGSTRDYQILAKHGHLNDGLGEGVSYRGRLMISVKTEIIDTEDIGVTLVEVEATPPVSEVRGGASYFRNSLIWLNYFNLITHTVTIGGFD